MSKNNKRSFSFSEKRAYYIGYGVGYRDKNGRPDPLLDRFPTKKLLDSCERGFHCGRKHALGKKGK